MNTLRRKIAQTKKRIATRSLAPSRRYCPSSSAGGPIAGKAFTAFGAEKIEVSQSLLLSEWQNTLVVDFSRRQVERLEFAEICELR